MIRTDKFCELRKIALDGRAPEKLIEEYRNHMISVAFMKAWELAVGPNDEELWKRNPEYAKVNPQWK